MSRRKAARSSGSRVAVVVLLLIVAALSAALWRIYPEYQRLKQRRAWPTSHPAARGVGQERAPTQQGQPTSATATLHFARVVEGKLRLVAVPRELPPGLGVARASLEQLIEGDIPSGCERPLPLGTKLRGVTVADGLATVDFSRELLTKFRGGSDNEGVTVYAIVDTLTSLPTIESVRILVEGKPASTIGGHLDLSAPLKFDGELVMK